MLSAFFAAASLSGVLPESRSSSAATAAARSNSGLILAGGGADGAGDAEGVDAPGVEDEGAAD
jgi:hypothetical protein